LILIASLVAAMSLDLIVLLFLLFWLSVFDFGEVEGTSKYVPTDEDLLSQVSLTIITRCFDHDAYSTYSPPSITII
jgi:hypothetical protein